MAKSVRRFFVGVLSTASLMQWLWTIGGGAVVSAAISAALGFPSPWGYVLAMGLFVLAAAAILALIEWLRKFFQPSLAERIETLIREGMKLLEELSAPMPVAKMGGTQGVRLGPEDAHIEKAFAFHERARELLGLIVLRCCRSMQTRPTISGGGNGRRGRRGPTGGSAMPRRWSDSRTTGTTNPPFLSKHSCTGYLRPGTSWRTRREPPVVTSEELH